MLINEIPLVPESQVLKIYLNNVLYKLSIVWRDSVYVLDVYDSLGVAIARGLSIVHGIDILTQLKYLGLNGTITVVNDTGDDAPIYNNLGITSHVVWGNT